MSTDSAHSFLNFLNNQSNEIKFTIEIESDGSIAFLDTEIIHDDNSVFDISWHYKPSNCGVYIPSCAYAPKKYKQAAMKCLFNRAKRICSTDVLYKKSCDFIISLFIRNGYSVNFILDVKRKVEHRPVNHSNRSNNNDQSVSENSDSVSENPGASDISMKIVYWKLPYIKESEMEIRNRVHRLNKILKDSKIVIVFKTTKTANFFHRKDKMPIGLSSNVIYKFSCEHCPKCYIGETTRHLQTRINEHIKGRPLPTEITLHNHVNDNSAFSVIARTNNTRIAESVLIAATDRPLLLNSNTTLVPLFLRL